MNNHPKHIATNCDFDRGLADILAVGVDVEGMLGFDAQARGLKVIDLRHAEVPPKIDGWEHAEQFERIDAAHDADIQQAVVHFGVGSDLHAPTIRGSVGEGCEDGGLVAADRPDAVYDLGLLSVGLSLWCQDFHWQRRKVKDGRGQAHYIPAVCPQPARQLVRATRDFAVQANAGCAAEVSSAVDRVARWFVWRGPALSDSRRGLARAFQRRNEPQVN